MVWVVSRDPSLIPVKFAKKMNCSLRLIHLVLPTKAGGESHGIGSGLIVLLAHPFKPSLRVVLSSASGPNVAGYNVRPSVRKKAGTPAHPGPLKLTNSA